MKQLVRCREFRCIQKQKNMITYPFVVGLQPFQRCGLFSNVFAPVGMQKWAGGTTTGGERPWIASEMKMRIFFVVAGVGGLWRQWWMARQRQCVSQCLLVLEGGYGSLG